MEGAAKLLVAKTTFGPPSTASSSHEAMEMLRRCAAATAEADLGVNCLEVGVQPAQLFSPAPSLAHVAMVKGVVE
jgi:hypothetical protein